MKYLKGTLVLFVATFLFAVVGAKASTLTVVGATIPRFSSSYISPQREKFIDTRQYVTKESCIDDWDGSGRVILAKLQGMYSGNVDTAWVEAKPKTRVAFNSNSEVIGAWRLWLKSQKSLPSTATYNGTWDYE